jgi:2-phospho-L-lactate/phosphoenolpyruvate guanylyltransferase
MILIPVKNLANAKQRLSSVLGPEERGELARAMCEDVLGAVASWRGRPEVAAVTGDPFAAELARGFGFGVITDQFNPGETGAIEMATLVCRERGAQSTLVIPADIPLIEESELQQIMVAAEGVGAVLVPDAARRGTNAVFRSPADLFPLRFGNDSFRPHLVAARATGLGCVVLELPGIARDVDRPEDLQALVTADGNRRSQQLVRSWNLDARAQVVGG